MRSLALATSSEPYEVELTSVVSALLFAMPVATVLKVHRRLQEVAEIAAVAGDLGYVVMDGGGDTLHLHVADFLVSYTVSDSRRLITVTGVAPDIEGD